MREMSDTRSQRKECGWWCVSLWAVVLCCLGMLPCVTSQAKEMFLNSLANCGHNDFQAPWHKVDAYSLYNVRDDVSPNTRTSTFLKNCQMVFRSVSSDGRLCVFQRSLLFTNDNMELRLYDGHEGVDGKTDADLTVNRDYDLPGVEWCTTGRFLTIEMVPRHPSASVKDMVIDLMVYHMSSRHHRKAYLDTSPSCGSEYRMDHSQVNVTNLDLRHTATQLHTICSLDFIYQGDDENRTLCLVFQPEEDTLARGGSGGEKGKCPFNYTLTVEATTPGPKQMLTIEGGCDRPTSHRWCSNATRVTLTLKRSPGQGPEDHILFQAVLLDHQGDPSTLPLLFKKSDQGVAAATTIIIVACAVLGSIVFIIIIFFFLLVLRRRRHLSNNRSPKKSRSDASNGNGKPEEQRLNGQTAYTQQTPQDV